MTESELRLGSLSVITDREFSLWEKASFFRELKRFKNDPTMPPGNLYTVAMRVVRFGDRIAPYLIPLLELNKHERKLSITHGTGEDWLRNRTAVALGYIGDRRAVEPLLNLIRDGRETPYVFSALGDLKDPRAVPVLVDYLDKEIVDNNHVPRKTSHPDSIPSLSKEVMVRWCRKDCTLALDEIRNSQAGLPN